MNATKKATNVRLSPETWQALRELAHRRALDRGGRTSASAVIEDLVQRETERVATTAAARAPEAAQ